MKRSHYAVLGGIGLLTWLAVHSSASSQVPASVLDKLKAASAAAPDAPEKKFEDFDKVVKGAKVIEGFIKLHQKDDKLFAELRPDQLDRPLLCPIAIARGMGMGGDTLNFDNQWVLMFRRVGDKVHLVRRNVRYTAKPGSPLAKAVETTYTDSVLMALRIQSINPIGQTVVINLNDIFMTDFADLGLGFFDSNRSYWHKVKGFSKNIELQVAATYSGSSRGRRFGGDSGVIDARGNTIIIHYGLCQLPEAGYQPRLADDRVGHFLSVVKDFSSESRDSSFLRYVNRWRLERAEPIDPKNPNKLSAPKKKIVFWIEKSVPDEYRSYVREGILEWNKAYEKIGFRDAIEVRQQESEDFDPEDINYNTFRWITTGQAFARGPSRANPLTGELLDADIVFDADWIRVWRNEYQVMSGGVPSALQEPASKIQAIRQGRGLTDPRLLMSSSERIGWNNRDAGGVSNGDFTFDDPRARLLALRQGVCQCTSHMHDEFGLAEMAMLARGDLKPGEKVPEEMIAQLIKEVVMHEVGHTLGLRHNFKASAMLKNDQLNDIAITRKQGMVGSVMDYNPVNIAPKGVKQGDYTTTTIGPYDYWVIEYAYKPLSGGTEGEIEELKKIAAKGALPGNDYGTDEDMYGTADPLVNTYDLGDPMKYAQDRLLLVEELMKDLADRVVEKGEGYQRARRAFSVLLGQYGNAAHLTANFVGGESIHRDHRDDPSGRDPFVPVKSARQRESLKFLQDHILTDKPFQFPPALLRKLAADRWSHWGTEGSMFSGVEFPLYERILNIQRVVLNHMFSGGVLSRIQNNALKCEAADSPLTTAEVFRSLTDGIWSDYPANGSQSATKAVVPIIRRNLQREHVKNLSTLVLGSASRGSASGEIYILLGVSSSSTAVPPDAKSLARMHLKEISKRITVALADSKLKPDDTTRAHLEECVERINKVLSASMQATEM